MKLWFRKKITKEDFDTEARKRLTPDTTRLHNEFMLALLNKCQTLAAMTVASPNVSAGSPLTSTGGINLKQLRPVSPAQILAPSPGSPSQDR